MVRLSRASLESWAMIRRQMLRETEVFLDDAVRHPERQPVIPSVRDGEAEFTPLFAGLFWSQVLGSS
jgi:hypothetical protein